MRLKERDQQGQKFFLYVTWVNDCLLESTEKETAGYGLRERQSMYWGVFTGKQAPLVSRASTR